jgi:hypothetical protein
VKSSCEFGIEPLGFIRNMQGNYRVSKQLGISRVVLSSMELVSLVISLSHFFPSFVRLIDVFNTLLVFSTLLSLL